MKGGWKDEWMDGMKSEGYYVLSGWKAVAGALCLHACALMDHGHMYV